MQLRTPRDFGALIRSGRRSSGLTQAELARKAGTTQRWMSQMENGKPTAEIGLVLRVLNELGVRLELGSARGSRISGSNRQSPAIDIDRIVTEATHPSGQSR